MFAQLGRTSNLTQALRYHERKLENGDARLIHASGFVQKPDELSRSEIQTRFKRLTSLRKSVPKPYFHSSLNFHPADAEKLSNKTLANIADRFMKGMGFENQPYVVYRHYDAAHSHIHILAPTVGQNGRRIVPLTARQKEYRALLKDIDETYQLVPYHRNKAWEPEKPKYPQKIRYGHSPVQETMEHAIDHILTNYWFTSFEAYNSLLRPYNIECIKNSKYRGLAYIALDDKGKRAGSFFHAHELRCRPTLDRVEKNFREFPSKRSELCSDIVASHYFNNTALSDFFENLSRRSIHVIIQHNDLGEIAGFHYVDYTRKCAYTENELPDNYSAKKILSRLGLHQVAANIPDQITEEKNKSKKARQKAFRRLSVATDMPENSVLQKVLEEQMQLSAEKREQRHRRTRPMDF